MPTGRFDEPSAPRLAAATWLVAKRDMAATLKTKSFIISNVVTLVLIFGAFLIGSLTGSGPAGEAGDAAEATAIGVVARPELAKLASRIPGAELTEAADDGAAIAEVAAGTAEVALVGSSTAPRLVGDKAVPDAAVDALTTAPAVELLNAPRLDDLARYMLSVAFGAVYMMMAMMYGQMIAQNTVVEKQTRIVEILLAAVPARAMLAGKIVGGAILAVGNTVLIAAICLVGLNLNGMTDWLAMIQAPMWWYVAFFLVGFVMYAAFFTAAGAMVSRMEDLSGAATPIMLLVMAPYFLVIAFNGSPVAMTVMAYVPFTSPVVMPVQMVLGDAQPIGAVISLVILAGTVVALGAAAVRIYLNSVLQIGARIKLREALRVKG
jgi:ABC-2 type transport system permease protein